ncbi:acid-sensing ion channel 4-B-like [Haliotis rufescens]|uniref:acid-sensing ion channel 4-B-like n=1 Tax=Haliotis rufescens TaxID=6454 RepID=UPI00201F7F3F|nr:acid-sensing ion channel 4-B-like [Haliotis rufescens]
MKQILFVPPYTYCWNDAKLGKDFNSLPTHPQSLISFGSIWWTFAVLLMSAYMSYNITQELMNYYRYPVITNTKVEVRQELPFPAITFCNQSPFNLTAVKEADPYLEKYFNGVSLLGSFNDAINWSDPGYGTTFSEGQSLDWWKKILMKPSQMLNLCIMKGSRCLAALKPVVTNMGHCTTFNWNASDVAKVRVTGFDNNLIIFADIFHNEYVIGSQMAAGLRVILHDPRIHPDVATSSFVAAPGTSTYAAVKRSTYIIDLGFGEDEAFIRDNILEIRIYYENLMLQVTEQSPQYTTETIIGNLGGQMGICLGASILTITELGEFVLTLCMSIFKKLRSGGKRKRIKPTKN